MLRPGERAKKTPKHHLEAILRVLRREFLNGRLFTNDELEFRNEVDNKLAVRAQRLSQRAPPLPHLCFASGEDLANKGPESLCQGRVGNVALVPIEFAGSEETARRDQRLLQLVYNRRLPNTGIARHKHELRCAMGHDSIERLEQSFNLPFPSIQFLRNQQPVRGVVRAKWERVDASAGFPFRQASPEIGFQACGRLVAFLGGLREELYDNG
jgi:hypothetical protein